jgi:hypothetical protein
MGAVPSPHSSLRPQHTQTGGFRHHQTMTPRAGPGGQQPAPSRLYCVPTSLAPRPRWPARTAGSTLPPSPRSAHAARSTPPPPPPWPARAAGSTPPPPLARGGQHSASPTPLRQCARRAACRLPHAPCQHARRAACCLPHAPWPACAAGAYHHRLPPWAGQAQGLREAGSHGLVVAKATVLGWGCGQAAARPPPQLPGGREEWVHAPAWHTGRVSVTRGAWALSRQSRTGCGPGA